MSLVISHLSFFPYSHAPCPMPHAQCPMPHAPFPINQYFSSQQQYH
ncbi:MAG: hypothetical protein V7L05_11325 [Nostoc sp.]